MPGRILIASEVATSRIVLKVKMAAASYDVVQAGTVAELREKSVCATPDLIILDGQFDNGRSIDLCQEIRENSRTSSVQIIIMAADFTPADRLAALHAGACDVLHAAVDETTLLARVRNSLRIRGIEKELRLREATAVELGFQEAATPFKRPAQILVVNGTAMADLGWQPAFEASTACSVHLVAHGKVHETIGRRRLLPDIILLPAGLKSDNDGLFLLAELRSRAETRHAAIIVVNDSRHENAAIAALDMGANEVVDATTPPAELAFRLARHFRRKQKSDRLRSTLADGLRMAVTDPLTSLFNRRYAFPHMARIAEKSNATNSPFAVMVLDLDRFKRINDNFGHKAGDMVLQEVARRLKANVRSIDLIARIGGEEFLVVMPDTGLNSARIAAERLRRVTGASPIRITKNQRSISVTTSIGVSIGGLQGQVATTVEAMIDRADQALLGAKSTGRNQVTFEQSAA